jgi:hypothetical protein
LLRGLSGRAGHAEFLKPCFDGAARLPDCFYDLVVFSVVGEFRQDALTRPKQFMQMIGFVHGGSLAAVWLLKTAVFFRQTLLVARPDFS